jgi:formylmethanofuran dehydrogenase subunit E
VKLLDEYLEDCARAHGHLCAGQVLGVRLAMHALRLLKIEEPRKRLLTWVEIDRCATDAITVVTGCRLGKRTLKFRDFGKMAATFCDLTEDRAVRVAARESSRQQAARLFPELATAGERQMRAYRELPDDALFTHQWVRVAIAEEDLPGFRRPRVVCEECGESVNFAREVRENGRTLCRACSGGRYWQPL